MVTRLGIFPMFFSGLSFYNFIYLLAQKKQRKNNLIIGLNYVNTTSMAKQIEVTKTFKAPVEMVWQVWVWLLYTSDAADDSLCVSDGAYDIL